MQVQINGPHETIPEAFAEFITRSITDELAAHESQLTRVEVHIKDLNGHKGGVDKRCLIEARPRGLKPVAAEHESTTSREAFKGALDKMQRVLAHRFGRLESKGRRE